MADPAIRLLLVEDNPPDALLLSHMLRGHGQYDIVEAATLRDARTALGRHPFDVILLDLTLPDSQGLTTVEQLHVSAPDTPIIVLTGVTDESVAMEAARRGAHDYLVKGKVETLLLARAIRYAMERQQSQATLKALNETLEQRVRERTAETEQMAGRLRALASELSQVEQKERRRLAVILHDHVQQLLAAALMQVGFLRKRHCDAEGREAIEQVDSTLREAIEAARSLTVELSPPVLHDAGLGAALDWLARRVHEKHQFKVTVEADPRAEPASSDLRVLLFDAIRELVFNAVKHSGTRSARIAMTRTADNCTQLTVEDDGAGFDSQERMSAGADQGGWGLFSIQQRLSFMGGQMTVESRPGQGTRITLRTPLHPKGRVAHAPAPRVDARAVGAYQLRPGERIRVLLVDDHKILRQGLAGLLQFEPDMEVVGEADDGRQAVELARRIVPDVVVMDVNMPGMNGVEATRIIRQEIPAVRVIGLSMHTEKAMAEAMRHAGAAAFVMKGEPSEDLLNTIRECCKSS